MSAGSAHCERRVSRVSTTVSGKRDSSRPEVMNRQEDIEPQHEDDWLCTVEFLPSDDLEGRAFAADIVGYLFGYAQLANARTLALVGDPEAGAYESFFFRRVGT